MTVRLSWLLRALGIIVAGLLSRAWHSGFVVVDKYLGDALYAAMVYALLRMIVAARPAAAGAAGIMVVIECFQLTGMPAAMVGSENRWVQIGGRLLGTQFGFGDLVAYAAGIGFLFGMDTRMFRVKREK